MGGGVLFGDGLVVFSVVCLVVIDVLIFDECSLVVFDGV